MPSSHPQTLNLTRRHQKNPHQPRRRTPPITPLRVVKARMIVIALENVAETIVMGATSDDKDPPPDESWLALLLTISQPLCTVPRILLQCYCNCLSNLL